MLQRLIAIGGLSIVLVCVVIAMSAPTSEAGAGPSCTRTEFKTVLVKNACTTGGQPGARDAMKQFIKNAQIKSCNQCHAKLAPTYELKPDALDQFAHAGGQLLDASSAPNHGAERAPRSFSSNVSVFASAPPTISTADLGRPCDENFHLIRGAGGSAIYPKQSGVTGGSRAMSATFIEITDTRAVQANADAWGIVSGGIGKSSDRRYLVYRASQQSDILQVDDTANTLHEPPPEATWYVASISVGRSFEIVISGDKQRFNAHVAAKVKAYGGSLDTFDEKSNIEWKVQGRGLQPANDKAILAVSPDDVIRAYKQSSDPVPVIVEYRNVPGRKVSMPERLEFEQPIEDNILVEKTPLSCTCTSGHNIAVTCQVRNQGGRAMDVAVLATAQSGHFSYSASGSARVRSLAPGKQTQVTVMANMPSALMDCSSAKDCACSEDVGARSPSSGR